MNILNRPKCFKCENSAITRVGRYWCCGNCYIKLIEKLNKNKEEIFLEE